MDVSLFKRLSDAHPQVTHHHRCFVLSLLVGSFTSGGGASVDAVQDEREHHGDSELDGLRGSTQGDSRLALGACDLDDSLQCGDAATADRRLEYSDLDANALPTWVADALSVHTAVTFVDTGEDVRLARARC